MRKPAPAAGPSTDSTRRLEPGAPSVQRLLPHAHHHARHRVRVRAPAALVLEVARTYDLHSHPLVRWIFRAREIAMRAAPAPAFRGPLVSEATRLGWGILHDEPDKEIVMGAVTRPWEANVTFRAVPAAEFEAFAEPGLVKIAWSLEAESAGPDLTLFSTETRVTATDQHARRLFARYWRFARFGILLIRLLMLPRIRHEAEHRHRLARGA